MFRSEGLRDNWGPKRVPAGQLFVMGDNRITAATAGSGASCHWTR
jgi:hypothetical protein